MSGGGAGEGVGSGQTSACPLLTLGESMSELCAVRRSTMASHLWVSWVGWQVLYNGQTAPLPPPFPSPALPLQ